MAHILLCSDYCSYVVRLALTYPLKAKTSSLGYDKGDLSSLLVVAPDFLFCVPLWIYKQLRENWMLLSVLIIWPLVIWCIWMYGQPMSILLQILLTLFVLMLADFHLWRVLLFSNGDKLKPGFYHQVVWPSSLILLGGAFPVAGVWFHEVIFATSYEDISHYLYVDVLYFILVVLTLFTKQSTEVWFLFLYFVEFSLSVSPIIKT